MILPRPATERVLPTLNPDGSRRWLDPLLSRGRFYRRRLALAWALIALFTLLPYLRMGGKPVILLDIVHREFTLFGTTFLPTDTMLLMLLVVGIFAAIFLLTAVYGRVWCGWGCPQTVYMEFVYRPIERLIEGGRRASADLGGRRLHPRRLLKYAVFAALSAFLAHTFLAYFVGVDALVRWVTRSPVEHPVAFLVMLGTAALMLLDFGFLREQVCLVACPYGRLQSVLLDRRSLIVGYDARRGEPRGVLRRRKAGGAWGDCIDCGLCVATCPTGIDIRNGLQMECIHCTQCIDACDGIMDRIGRPRGLIRYSSRDELAGEPRRLLRPRIVLYPVLVLAALGALVVTLTAREPADITVLRASGSPFSTLPSGEVSNQVRLKIVNRTGEARRYWIAIDADPAVRLVTPVNPVPVEAGKTATAVLFVTAPGGRFTGGEMAVRLAVSDDGGFRKVILHRLLGPGQILGRVDRAGPA
jgi:cytochrome c oxidase accessory protein FixG